MARKTIKGLELIIEDLEKRLNEYMNMISERDKQIFKMESIANDSFENSTDYRRMNNEIDYLKTVIKGHEITIKAKDDTIKRNRDTIQKLLKETEELKSNNCVNKLKNERGAGRKEKFTVEEVKIIKDYRAEGKSYKAIAEIMKCSVGLVHKLINE